MRRCIIGFLTLFLTVVAFGQNTPNTETVKIAEGPYLLDVTADGFTVVWTTNMDAVAWVEVAPVDGTHFYTTARPKYEEATIGRRHIGQLHCVRVTGLQPGKNYRYRLLQRGIVLNEGNKGIIMGNGRGSNYDKPYRVRTLDAAAKSTRFWVVNDIEGKESAFKSIMSGIKDSKADFVIFNGDMVSSMESREGLFAGCLKPVTDIIAKEGLPFFASRGDNEMRGKLAEKYLDYFPTSTGETYYSFRQGPAYFVVLDAGGDKPADDMGEFDLISADSFREQEAVWLKGVVESEEYRAAPIHIAVMHRAPAGKKGEHTEQETRRLFVPLLNDAGIDIMFCAHDRSYQWIEDKSRGTNFPILINSDENRLVVDVTASGIKLDVVNAGGNVIKHHNVKK